MKEVLAASRIIGDYLSLGICGDFNCVDVHYSDILAIERLFEQREYLVLIDMSSFQN